MLALVSAYAAMNVKIHFQFTDLIPVDTMAYQYFRIDWNYIKQGFSTTVYVENDSLDYSSEDVQLQMQDFNDKL